MPPKSELSQPIMVARMYPKISHSPIVTASKYFIYLIVCSTGQSDLPVYSPSRFLEQCPASNFIVTNPSSRYTTPRPAINIAIYHKDKVCYMRVIVASKQVKWRPELTNVLPSPYPHHFPRTGTPRSPLFRTTGIPQFCLHHPIS